jgi:hypothetical protein
MADEVQGRVPTDEEEELFRNLRAAASEVIQLINNGKITLILSEVVDGNLFLARPDEVGFLVIATDGRIGHATQPDMSTFTDGTRMDTLVYSLEKLSAWIKRYS